MASELRIGNENTGFLLKETPLQDTTGLLKALVFDPATGEVKYFGVLPNISNVNGTYDLQNLDKPFVINCNGHDYIIGQYDALNDTFTGFSFQSNNFSFKGNLTSWFGEVQIISGASPVYASIIGANGGAVLSFRSDGIFDFSGGAKNSVRDVTAAGGITIALSNRYILLRASAGSVRLPSVPALELNRYLGITFTIMNRTGSQQILIPDTTIGLIEGSASNYSIADNTNVEVMLVNSTNGWVITSKTTI